MLISTLQQSFPVHACPSLIAPSPVTHFTLEDWYLLTFGYEESPLEALLSSTDWTRHVQKLMVQEHTCLLNQLQVQQQSQTFYEHSAVDRNTAQNRAGPQKASGRMQETNFCLLLSLCIHVLHVKLPLTCGKLVKFVTCQTAATVPQRELKTSVKS